MIRSGDVPVDAAEIRMRAERRLGELIRAQRETVGLAPAGRPRKIGSDEEPISKPPTLADAGIDKKRSHDATVCIRPHAQRLLGDNYRRPYFNSHRLS